MENRELRNAQIAAFLREVGKRYSGESDKFKKKAHETAANNIAGWPMEVHKMTKNGSLKMIPGVGDSIERKISTFLRFGEYEGITIESIEKIKKRFTRDELGDIIEYLTWLFEPMTTKFEVAGSWRREKETIGDLDLVCCSEDPIKLMSTLREDVNTKEVLSFGPAATSVIIIGIEVQVDIRMVPEESFGACLLFFTGSQGFNIQMRSRAKKQGKKLNRYGVYQGETLLVSKTEEEIFDNLGVMYTEPKFREEGLLNWS